MISSLVMLVMLLIEANSPGFFMTTELQVRTRSALVNTRLVNVSGQTQPEQQRRSHHGLPHNIHIIVGHLENLPLFVT